MPDYTPQLRWLFVPDVGHLLVLADAYNPVEKSVRVLDLSLNRTVRGVPVPVGRVPVAAIIRPRAYPRTLLGKWRDEAWARWKIEKELRAASLKADGPSTWNAADYEKFVAQSEREAAAERRRSERSREYGRGYKHRRT